MDKSELEKIKSVVLSAIANKYNDNDPSYEDIKKTIKDIMVWFGCLDSASEKEINVLQKSITEIRAVSNGTKMIAVVNRNSDAPRWLDAKKHEINWDHWTAYKRFLQTEGRSKDVIDENEKVIDTILDYTGNPKSSGSWAKKGLVMGNVQSGKTQNYLGLINKAIDAGYKTIILLGGHLNDLRMQTQERVDEGVLGDPSRHKVETPNQQSGHIGVGHFHRNTIIPATTTKGDFNKSFADRFAIKLDRSDPVIFTIKKNTSVLKTLYKWIDETHSLDAGNRNLLSQPMLLIDDEADYASINTKHHKETVTLTNALIRQLLSLFSKSTYVAYTATPFANIFIDPDESSYTDNDDLFPSDFMVRLPLPSTYMGEQFFFGRDALDNELNATCPVIEIDDHWPVHGLKNDNEIEYDLPESLKDAVRAFFIVMAVRSIRGEEYSHNTMLVNISHLKLHQDKFEEKIEAYRLALCEALDSFGSLGEVHASRNDLLSDLAATYTNKFQIKEDYSSVLKMLSGKKRRTIEVWALNQSGRAKDRRTLNYSTYSDYGLNVIVIGGHKLSRGLTLEGLSISYFARNSKAYDTLMQMCRWFGYRGAYKDLCKVYLPSTSIHWYAFIADVIQELYSELALMASRGERPKDFGLKVREHPGAMLVSAANKIGAGKSGIISQSLWGQVQRRFKFLADPDVNANNIDYAKRFLDKLCSNSSSQIDTEDPSGSVLISNVSYQDIINFIESIDLPEDDLGNKPLIKQLNSIKEEGKTTLPKVVLYNQKTQKKETWFEYLENEDKEFLGSDYEVAGHSITLATRGTLDFTSGVYKNRNANLGNRDDEKLFLTKQQRALVQNSSASRTLSDHNYIASADRDFVGLKIYFFGLTELRKDDTTTPQKLIHGREATLGYTISFPRPEHLKNLTPTEIKDLVKNTRHSYKYNKIYEEHKDLTSYSDNYDDD